MVCCEEAAEVPWVQGDDSEEDYSAERAFLLTLEAEVYRFQLSCAHQDLLT